MAYRNGKDALPKALLHQVQRYAAGDCLYIPKEPAPRKKRGPGADIILRNREIREAYRAGVPVRTLAQRYFLSPQSIYKILHQK